MRKHFLKMACASCVGLASVALFAQDAARGHGTTTNDGVYTAAQAASGKAVYSKDCTVCHMDNLAGGGSQSPPLKGSQFISDFSGKPLRKFYSRIISTMPQADPGSLSDAETLELVAYILEQNGFPAGKAPLGPPDALNDIQFVAPK